MSSLSRVARGLIWGIIAGWIIAILRRMLMQDDSQRATRPWKAVSKPVPPKAIALHRDPWCGTFVSPEISVRWEQAGQVEHFCSRECLSRYAGSQRRAANA